MNSILGSQPISFNRSISLNPCPAFDVVSGEDLFISQSSEHCDPGVSEPVRAPLCQDPLNDSIGYLICEGKEFPAWTMLRSSEREGRTLMPWMYAVEPGMGVEPM